MSDWQPIETAPKDGTAVLVKSSEHPEYGEQVLWFDVSNLGWAGMYPGIAGWIDMFWDLAAPQPTHWMPLPPSTGTRRT